MLRKLNEAKLSGHIVPIIKYIRENDSNGWGKISDESLNNLFKLYRIDQNVDYFTCRDGLVDPADFLDWLQLSGSFGNFIMDYYDQLNIETIYELAANDPEFEKALWKAGRDLQITDKKHRDVIGYFAGNHDQAADSRYVSAKNVDLHQLVKWLFSEMNKVTYPKGPYDPTIPLDDLSDDAYLDQKLQDDMLKHISKFYNSTNESLNESSEEEPKWASVQEIIAKLDPKFVKEFKDTYKDTSIEQYVQSNLNRVKKAVEKDKYTVGSSYKIPSIYLKEDLEEQEVETAAEPVVNQSIATPAILNETNSIIQSIWTVINNINGFILDLQDIDNLEPVDILNNVIDDLTINIGMIQQIADSIDDKKADLINQGKEKANDLIGSDNSEDTEDIEDEDIEDEEIIEEE